MSRFTSKEERSSVQSSMAPSPPLTFHQALALLQSRQHSSLILQPTSRDSSSRLDHTAPRPTGPIVSFQDALAMLQRGDHRSTSHVPRHAVSHQVMPSMHRQHADSARRLSQLSPSQNTSQERTPRTSSASTSLYSSTRSPQVEPPESVAASFSFQQALAMLQRGEHRTSSLTRDRPQRTTTNTSIEQVCHSSTLGLRSTGSITPTFQEALARLHREHQQREEGMHTARSRQEIAVSRYLQETHAAMRQGQLNGERPRPVSTASTQVPRSPTSLSSSHYDDDIERHGQPRHQHAATLNVRLPEANGNYTNVTDWQMSDVNVLEGGHNVERQSHMTLANLPSLSFEVACNIINWRSATKLEIMNCGICLDDFESEDEVNLLPNCGHLFHVKCVNDWLLRVGSCPCCRDIIINIDDAAQQ